MNATPSIHQEISDAWRGDRAWDGRGLGYVPREPLAIDKSLRIFSGSVEPDPVTYQVLRWKLWNLNLEHSETIKRVSGSPAIVYMDDFATSILTGRGENIVCGPTIQYFTGLADLIIKWTLENRSANPGIQDADIFLQNDPYIGAAHQIDTALYMPVFWQGELFCWIFNSAHQGDIGGIAPGSFCVSAQDIFQEPVPVPPLKIARNGVLQDDVADAFVRRSRTPELVALQLRSQIAGLQAVRRRVLELLAQYGAEVFNGTMNKMISDCASAVARRLQGLPDGTFEEVIYVGGLTPEDRAAHRYRLAIRKEGGMLTCTNEGTDRQFGAANCTYSAWRSAIVCAVSSMLAHDQLSCPAGVLAVLQFEPVPGLLNCVSYPGAVTTLVSTTVSVYLASQVVGRILLTGPPEIAATAIAAGAGSVPSPWVLAGVDQAGRRIAEVTGDGIAGGTGASRFNDGIDNGGAWYMPGNVAGDVEEWEQAMPMLYLYRREHMDSGGAGRMRGGNGLAAAITGHKTSQCEVQTINVDTAVNATPGMAGGFPGHSGNVRYLADVKSPDVFQIDDAPERPQRSKPKSRMRMLPGDVMLFQVCGSGGFGDPLRRDVGSVQLDVTNRSISGAAAERLYGVVIADGKVDLASTEKRRAHIRAERAASAVAPVEHHDKNGAKITDRRVIGDGLAIAGVGQGAWWICNACDHHLAPVTSNYKAAAATLSVNPTALDPEIYPETTLFCDDPLEMRMSICPGCGTLLTSEICRVGDPVRSDIRIDPQSLKPL